jgi:hypothetical protein
MFRVTILLMIAVFFQTSSLDLNIGATVSKDDIDEFKTQALILHNGDLKPSIEKKINDVVYRIAYEPETNKIVQINTFDSNFQSSDGVHVYSYVEATKNQIVPTESSNILGPKTEDNWQTVLGTDFEITIQEDGKDKRIVLSDEKSETWSVHDAKKKIKKLFVDKKSIKVKVDQFTKIKE